MALAPASVVGVAAGRRIVVLVGSGGVGKTTTAAALGLALARAGRETLVLTIDPAKRLATSLGLPEIGHEPRRVPAERLPGAAPLWAMMLDQKRAFDEVVAEAAKDPAAAARVLANPIYRQMSTALAGAHEYAAMAKLCTIAKGPYAHIVVDTPPTAHALDFLEAPAKIAAAVDSPMIEWFTASMRQTGRFSLRLVEAGGAFVLRRIARFVGSAFLDDMARFFVDASDVLAVFRRRSAESAALFRSPEVGFFLVAAADPAAVEEALFLRSRLASLGVALLGVVVNRTRRGGPIATAEELAARLRALPGCPLPPAEIDGFAEGLAITARDIANAAAGDRYEADRLALALGPGRPVARVPLLARDVHDLDALLEVVGHLS